jgi:hypothetical protein
MQRVVRSHRAHQEYLKYRGSLADSDDDDGPQNDDAWLFEDLVVLTKLYSRLRDKEQLISLIFEVSRDMAVYSLADGKLPNVEHDCRPNERYHNDILLSSSAGLQGSKHRRFYW